METLLRAPLEQCHHLSQGKEQRWLGWAGEDQVSWVTELPLGQLPFLGALSSLPQCLMLGGGASLLPSSVAV